MLRLYYRNYNRAYLQQTLTNDCQIEACIRFMSAKSYEEKLNISWCCFILYTERGRIIYSMFTTLHKHHWPNHGNAQASTPFEPLRIVTVKAGKKITRSHPTLIAHLHIVDWYSLFPAFNWSIVFEHLACFFASFSDHCSTPWASDTRSCNDRSQSGYLLDWIKRTVA